MLCCNYQTEHSTNHEIWTCFPRYTLEECRRQTTQRSSHELSTGCLNLVAFPQVHLDLRACHCPPKSPVSQLCSSRKSQVYFARLSSSQTGWAGHSSLSLVEPTDHSCLFRTEQSGPLNDFLYEKGCHLYSSPTGWIDCLFLCLGCWYGRWSLFRNCLLSRWIVARNRDTLFWIALGISVCAWRLSFLCGHPAPLVIIRRLLILSRQGLRMNCRGKITRELIAKSAVISVGYSWLVSLSTAMYVGGAADSSSKSSMKQFTIIVVVYNLKPCDRDKTRYRRQL